jgi:hypothetical protein
MLFSPVDFSPGLRYFSPGLDATPSSLVSFYGRFYQHALDIKFSMRQSD